MKPYYLALAALLLAGCACEASGRCTNDSMCGIGRVCTAGVCGPPPALDAGVDGSEARPDVPGSGLCPGGGRTTVSGIVRIPAGTLPVPGAVVYLASAPPAPITTGVDGSTCLRCDAELSNVVGEPTRTAIDGTFVLPVPPGDDLRLIVQIGKWRRETRIAHVDACLDNPLDADSTRLPRNRFEGHIPRIALTTGSCDGMECLLRKLGIDDSEFTTPDGPGRVNLFADVACVSLPGFPEICESGRDRFDASLGGERFPDSSDWWSSADNLDDYDVVLHSCECAETLDNKPPAALSALVDYANRGGRVFLTHYHYAWLESSTDSTWRSVATWNGAGDFDRITGDIDTSFDRGMRLADWMMLPEVGGSAVHGEITLFEARQSLTAVDSVVRPWITIGGTPAYFSFDTPFGAPDTDVCGRVVFSDIHVSAADQAGNNPFAGGPPPFPVGCTSELLAQEKALIYLLFDLTNCVGPEIPF